MKETDGGHTARELEVTRQATKSGATNPSHDRRPQGHGSVETTSGLGPMLSQVTLRIHEVTCQKTTKEIDRDEIVLTAIKTHMKVETTGNGRVAGISEEDKRLEVGEFQKGASKTYGPPQPIAQFSLGGEKPAWPRYYVATLLLIEKDEGAIGTIVNATIDAIDEQVKEAVAKVAASAAGAVLTAAAAGAAAGSAIPLVGTAVGAAAAAAVGVALEAIKKSRADDCFPPQQVRLVLDSAPRIKGEVAESRGIARFNAFNGVYKVVYSWSVV
jgi:hypothetical protein